jgi:hypothetical protein
VIIHAIFNLQSTYATSATLTITASRGLPLTLGIGDHVQSGHKDLSEPKTVFTVPLRSLLYGQPRDIVFSYDKIWPIWTSQQTLHAEIRRTPLERSTGTRSIACDVQDMVRLPESVAKYHCYRFSICSFLGSLAPLSQNGERTSLVDVRGKRGQLESLISQLKAERVEDVLNQSLLHDLSGQISLALSAEYYQRWGKHFLLSMHGAHFGQFCNSFKHPGLL